MNNLNKKWFIRIDIQREIKEPLLGLVTNDKFSNIFIITLLNNGSPIELKDSNIITLNIEKPDKTKVIISGNVIDKGTISFMLDFQAVAKEGICNANIRVIDNDSIVTSEYFQYFVYKDPYQGTDGSIESESKFPVLEELLVKVQKALDELLDYQVFINANIDDLKELVENIDILKELYKDKVELKQLLEQAEKIKSELEKLLVIKEYIAQAEKAISDFKEMMKDYNVMIKLFEEHKITFDDLIDKLTKLIADGTDLYNKLKALLDRLPEVDARIAKLESLLSKATDSIVTLEKDIQKATEIREDLKLESSNGLKVIEDSKIIIEKLKGINQTATDKIIELKTQILESENLVNESVKKINKSVTEGVDEINSTISKGKTDIDSYAINTINIVKDESNKVIEESRKENKTLTESISSAKIEIEKLQKLLENINNISDKLNIQLSNAEEIKDKLKEIMEAGDLDKYVTDIKLNKALEEYISKLNITSDLKGNSESKVLSQKAGNELFKKIDEHKGVEFEYIESTQTLLIKQ